MIPLAAEETNYGARPLTVLCRERPPTSSTGLLPRSIKPSVTWVPSPSCSMTSCGSIATPPMSRLSPLVRCGRDDDRRLGTRRLRTCPDRPRPGTSGAIFVEQLSRWRWGPIDPEPGLDVSQPDRARTLEALQAAAPFDIVELAEERAAIGEFGEG